MANISYQGERSFSIREFLGLNENPSGDTRLKTGEAAEMSNFKITDEGSLQIRGGTKNVAGLLPNAEYVISVPAKSETTLKELNTPRYSFTAYPSVMVSVGGILVLTGDPVTVNYENFNSYRFYYRQDSDGKIFKLDTCVYTPASGDFKVSGGAVSIAADEVFLQSVRWISDYFYDRVEVSGGRAHTSGVDYLYNITTGIGKFHVDYLGGPPYIVTSCKTVYGSDSVPYSHWYGKLLKAADDVYEWKFYSVTATTELSDLPVRGIWSGYVGGTEYLVAACASRLWSLTISDGEVWTKLEIGEIDTSKAVSFFGFSNRLYILNGSQYKVWDGSMLTDVGGYVPVVAISTPPGSGSKGALYEPVNKLTGSKRQRFTPTGTSGDFQLCEQNITKVESVRCAGVALSNSSYTVNASSGLVSISRGLTEGVNLLEIQWSKGGGDRGSVLAMRYSELYNGANDSRVFLYGDGSNTAIYSGLDEFGEGRADYFPDLNTMSVGDSNTPVTGLTRHYDRLIAFKEDSTYSISYGTITLEDSTVTAGFYLTPINKGLGNCALGQVQVVENNPRTLDGRSIYEWVGISNGITNDQRNARRISQRIETTLSGFDLKSAATYFDKINHEYYILQDSAAIIHNTENDTWYVYRDFPASCIIVYKDEVYIGTFDGYIRHLSREYKSDNGEPIAAYWESGSMDFGADYKYKNSSLLWIGLKPEPRAAVNVTVQTDAQSNNDDADIIADYTAPVSNGIVSFLELNFSRFSFGTARRARVQSLKIKVKRFMYYKLIFTSLPNATATIVSADIKVNYTGNVR